MPDPGGVLGAIVARERRDVAARLGCVSLEISGRGHVHDALRAGAAGVISGSAIVKLVGSLRADPIPAVRHFVAAMKEATREAADAPQPRLMEAGDVR